VDPIKANPIEALADAKHEFGEHGGVNMSIEASTTFTVMNAHTMPEIFQGQHGPDEGGCYLYGRHFNPTVYNLGKQVAAIEGSEAGYACASGMGAISAAITQICNAGDHIVSTDTLYGGTYAFFHDYLPLKCNIETTFVAAHDLEQVENAFRDNTKVLYVETMSNPTLRVSDIPKLAKIAHDRGAKLVVDNTFTPLVVSPIRLGADVVVASATKFLNGASDFIAGVICGSYEFIGSLMDLHVGSLMLLGPTMDPRTAFDISLRLPHLGLRMVEHGKRASIFAQRIQDLGIDVIYPGLTDHPDHEVLKRIANDDYGAGGVFALDVGSSERADALMETLQNDERFGYMAVSLGYFDTLMSCSARSTSSEMTDEALRQAGIAPGLVRISIGYTGSVEQRWSQFERALKRVGVIS